MSTLTFQDIILSNKKGNQHSNFNTHISRHNNFQEADEEEDDNFSTSSSKLLLEKGEKLVTRHGMPIHQMEVTELAFLHEEEQRCNEFDNENSSQRARNHNILQRNVTTSVNEKQAYSGRSNFFSFFNNFSTVF